MYKFKVKNNIYTIPKENLRLLALTKAMDVGAIIPIKDDADAISFLKEIGIEFLEGVN